MHICYVQRDISSKFKNPSYVKTPAFRVGAFSHLKNYVMKVNIKKTINAPSDILWSYLADYSNIHRYHPLLKGSHFIEGAETCELGSTRQCNMKDGNYIKERVSDWKEGSHYTVDIYETSMPIKNATATLGVTPLGNGTTEAYMQLDLEPKYKIMQPILYLMFRYVAGPSILNGLSKLYKKEHLVKAFN